MSRKNLLGIGIFVLLLINTLLFNLIVIRTPRRDIAMFSWALWFCSVMLILKLPKYNTYQFHEEMDHFIEKGEL